MSCFAHRHMTPQEFGVYKYIEAVAHQSGIFYSDARAMSEEFEAREWRTCKRLVDSLSAKGWLRLLKAPARNAQGIFTCAHYALVSHSEWVETHPNKCRLEPLPPVTTDSTSAISDSGRPLQPAAVDESIATSDNGNPLQLETPPLPPVSQPLPRVTTSVASNGTKSSKAEVRKDKSEKKSQKQPLGAFVGSSKPSGQEYDSQEEFETFVRGVEARNGIAILPTPARFIAHFKMRGESAVQKVVDAFDKREKDNKWTSPAVRHPRKVWEWTWDDLKFGAEADDSVDAGVR
jgi:hypothetical protein